MGALATSLLGVTEPAEADLALGQAQAAQKPNLLFILVDNLGYGELGVYGGGATRGALLAGGHAAGTDQPHLPTLPNPAFAGKTGHGDWADMLAEMDAPAGGEVAHLQGPLLSTGHDGFAGCPYRPPD